jgi:hypothetical protein
MRALLAFEQFVAPNKTRVDPGAQVSGRKDVDLVWTFVADH